MIVPKTEVHYHIVQITCPEYNEATAVNGGVMNVDINYLAVLIAGLSSMLVGSILYMPKVFGTKWAKLAKVNLNKKMPAGEMIVLMTSTLAASLLTAYILAHVTFLSNYFFGNSYLQDALSTAFWLWLGLTAVRIYVHDAFEGRPFKLTLLTAGHELVTIMLMGLIIGLIGR
jgi:hypothetical protein